MKKLTKELMVILATASNYGTTCLEHAIPELLAEQFQIAKNPKLEAPEYMRKFWKEYSKPLTGGQIAPKYSNRKRLKPGNFVFTSAQNNTDVHQKFFASLQNFCKHKNAELKIGKFTYNKSVFRNGVHDNPDEIYFAKELEPFFLNEDAKIQGLDIVWAGSFNILPTVQYPLNGMSSYTGQHSMILPHAKISMESVATQKGESAKFMYSTGAITLRSYTDTKQGRLAEAAHNFGALYLECRNGTWFAYQIETDESGEFQHLTEYFTPDTVNQLDVAAINWGDIHAEHAAKNGRENLFVCKQILNELNPSFQFFHDTLDFQSRNHHNRNDPHFLARMAVQEQTVMQDLNSVVEVMETYFEHDSKWIFVESNHDLALEAWLKDTKYDFRYDNPENALLYFKLQALIYQSILEGDSINIMEQALYSFVLSRLREKKPNWNDCVFLNIDSSYTITLQQIECGMHGHIGSNGSKGSPKQLTKLSKSINSGHTHSASIYGAVYTSGVVGSDSLDMGYNLGASSWSHSHILTYANGFRTIITVKKSKVNGFWYW